MSRKRELADRTYRPSHKRAPYVGTDAYQPTLDQRRASLHVMVQARVLAWYRAQSATMRTSPSWPANCSLQVGMDLTDVQDVADGMRPPTRPVRSRGSGGREGRSVPTIAEEA